MKKRICAIFFLAFLILTSADCLKAQGSFRPGYIVTVKGDTIKGLIDHKKWDRTPTRVTFKGTVEEIRYKPIDIASFHVEEESYISVIIKVDHSKFLMHELEKTPEPNFEIDTIFIKHVFKGEKNLFYHKDDLRKIHFFIHSKDTPLEPLVYKKYFAYGVVLDNYSKFLTENIGYTHQLARFFQDCPDIQPKIRNTPYDLKNLKKLFEDYTACKH